MHAHSRFSVLLSTSWRPEEWRSDAQLLDNSLALSEFFRNLVGKAIQMEMEKGRTTSPKKMMAPTKSVPPPSAETQAGVGQGSVKKTNDEPRKYKNWFGAQGTGGRKYPRYLGSSVATNFSRSGFLLGLCLAMKNIITHSKNIFQTF